MKTEKIHGRGDMLSGFPSTCHLPQMIRPWRFVFEMWINPSLTLINAEMRQGQVYKADEL